MKSTFSGLVTSMGDAVASATDAASSAIETSLAAAKTSAGKAGHSALEFGKSAGEAVGNAAPGIESGEVASRSVAAEDYDEQEIVRVVGGTFHWRLLQ